MRSSVLAAPRFAGLVLISLCLVGAIVAAAGYSPATILTGVWEGAVTAPGAWETTLRWAIPMLIIALGVAISFRAGFFNIGAQGQFYAGSIASTALALELSGPAFIVVPVAVAGGIVAGMLTAFVPGILRTRFGTDEVLTTLMLNYVLLLLVQYVAAGPLKDPSGSGQVAASRSVDSAYRLSDSSGVSVSIWALVALVVLGSSVLLYRTSFGVQCDLAGRNPLMARWQGIRVGHIGIVSFVIAGALAGLAGAIEILGPNGRLVAGASPNLGFTAILVAVVGALSVAGAVAAAVFFGGLQAAILYLPITSNLPQSSLDLLQGVISLLITVKLATGLRRRRRSAEPSESAGRVPEQTLEAAR